MYLNIQGNLDLINNGTFLAEVRVSPFCPENIIHICKLEPNDFVVIITAPCNLDKANVLLEQNNRIYNSPLAKALREER